MKSPSSNFVFSRVPSVARPRSVFDRSRYYKSAFNEGKLIPFFVDEVLPGDTFNLSVSAFARLATLIVPFMDNLYLDFFFFFVPNRLVWDNWQRFCGEQDNPDDSTDYLVPQVSLGEVAEQSIYDYFGLPLMEGSTINVNAMPFRAYNLIWNEFFRDENLQDSVTVPTGDGPDTRGTYTLLYRGKRKSDPFTSALPWPQKGPGVELPIGGYSPVGSLDSTGVFRPVGLGSFSSHQAAAVSMPAGQSGTLSLSSAMFGNSSDAVKTIPSAKLASTGYESVPLVSDLTVASAVTINAMREAFQVQRWYERLAVGGSRYVELVLSMFGCHTGDARLQRPEYLGGGSTPIQVHSVVQSSSTDSESPQGNLAGYGIGATQGIGFSKSFVEHGHVIGLVCVRGDYGYQQGIDRFWSRRTKFDFYWPAFAHLGEVPVLNKEIFFSGNSDVDNAAFGYQERWYEYRYGINKITGKLRSASTDSLEFWHLAQNFATLPTLNSTFIKESPPVNRVVAVSNEPHFIFDSVISCKCARVMPTYSVPGLIDHF